MQQYYCKCSIRVHKVCSFTWKWELLKLFLYRTGNRNTSMNYIITTNLNKKSTNQSSSDNFNAPEVKMSDVQMWTAILASAFIHTVVSPDTIQQYKKKCNRKKNSDSSVVMMYPSPSNITNPHSMWMFFFTFCSPLHCFLSIPSKLRKQHF